MALDYRKCAEEISAAIGGGSNVISAAHCATRLRLVQFAVVSNDQAEPGCAVCRADDVGASADRG